VTFRLPAMPEFAPGEVWLVGAGPGDPGLLTLFGAHAMANADVIVHDALVAAAVLDIAPPGTQRIHAGKRGGKPSPAQPDITRRIIDLAREGRRVLRLKGGDPFVFGRGGEEALALARAGVPFRIVPGITAGLGGLAYAAIPPTHRDTNSAVLFITGHDAAGQTPGSIDWTAAAGCPVIVVYMGLKHLGEIAARLVAAGREPGEAVALIQDATLPGQRVVVTTLDRAAEDAAAHAIAPPVIAVIGPVVALREVIGAGMVGAVGGAP
jgi:uroporphyrin-III C-methyltransferase